LSASGETSRVEPPKFGESSAQQNEFANAEPSPRKRSEELKKKEKEKTKKKTKKNR